MKRILLTTDPDQQFGLLVNNTRITMRVRYNPTTDRWSFDLARDDDWVLQGRRIVPGANLLKGTALTDLGAIFAYTATPGSLPDRTGLPSGRVEFYYA